MSPIFIRAESGIWFALDKIVTVRDSRVMMLDGLAHRTGETAESFIAKMDRALNEGEES